MQWSHLSSEHADRYLDTFLSALGSRKRRGELVFKDGQGRVGRYFGEVEGGKANGFGKWVCSTSSVFLGFPCATDRSR